MPEVDENISKYKKNKNPLKAPFIIFADTESLLGKIYAFSNNPDESCKTKITTQTARGYSLFTHCSFDSNENKYNFCRVIDCMEKFSPDLVKHAPVIINYEKKEK